MRSTIPRILLGYVLAVLVATAAGSVFQTQLVLAGLVRIGAEISLAARLEATLGDLLGLAPQFGMIVAIAFAIGFTVAAIVKRLVRPLAPIAYPLAGAAALGTALLLMAAVFDGITPIAGARGAVGFGLQCLAGAIGGAVFTAIVARRRSA